jgi:hypothetical protein
MRLARGGDALGGGEAEVRTVLRVAVRHEPRELPRDVGQEARLIRLEDFTEGGQRQF